MVDLGEWLLTGLLNHGNLLLGTTLFFAALGIPLPATMLLMAAGAFTQQGELSLQGALISASCGAIAGDGCSYLLGRFSLKLAPRRLLDSSGWLRANILFARWGGWSVFITRFLVTPVALPVNLLAGSTRYGWMRFMLAVVAGELIWVLLFGGLGRLFADQWETLSQLATDLGGVLLGIVLLAAGIRLVIVRRRR